MSSNKVRALTNEEHKPDGPAATALRLEETGVASCANGRGQKMDGRAGSSGAVP